MGNTPSISNSEDSYVLDNDGVERQLQAVALAQEKEEQQKTLKRLTKALVPPVGDEDDIDEESYQIDIDETERAMEDLAQEVAAQNYAQIDEELRIMREDLNKSFNDLKREFAKPLPASVMSSARSSPNIHTSTV